MKNHKTPQPGNTGKNQQRMAQDTDTILNELNEIAIQAALQTLDRHDYLPNNAAEAKTWRPHFWVVQAMRAAINFDRRMNRAAMPQTSTAYDPRTPADMLVNGGALKLALNVLHRAGKHEVADELSRTATLATPQEKDCA